MLNLLRMDLRRMFRGKAAYVCLGILVFTTVFTYTLMYVIQDPGMREFLIKHGMTITATSGNIKESLNSTSLVELFHQTNVSGGLLPVISGTVAALFICTDFDSGFIKNIRSVHENKWDYILSKGACLFLVNLFFIAVTFLTALGLNAVFGGFFFYNKAVDMLFYVFCIWMVSNGFSALILMICMITRSKAAGVAGAFILCSGLVVLLVSSLLNLFGAGEIMNYTLYMNLAECPLGYDGLSTLRPVIVGAVFCIIYAAAGKVILSKKDI